MLPATPHFSVPSSSTAGRTLWVVGLLVAALAISPSAAHAQNTFTVDSTGDAADANPGDGTCATSGGACTLRAAIEEANATANSGGADEIAFSIPGSVPHTIQPQSPLPDVTDPVEIEGATEPDYNPGDGPVIVIDGQNAGPDMNGLTVTANEGILSELAIINFDGNGLFFDGGSNISLLTSYIGVAPDGAAAGNLGNGIEMANGATSNYVASNVISANSGRGIFLGVGGADDNIIVGNYIGTGPDGTSDMGNGFEGILANSVTGTRIGVSNSGGIDGNVISGNGRAGVYIVGGDALIRGNAIGTNAAETAALGNDQAGVELSNGASGVRVGGTTNASGDDAGNVISGNGGHGVIIAGSSTTANIVLGNHIGTNGAGDALLGNSGDGVRIENDAAATVGGTADGEENVIAGNEDEVFIASSGNTVQGNYIGTNANADNLGSSFNAIDINGGSGNLIGGSAGGAGNVIGYTATNSVGVSGTNNTVQGNFIGTNPAGDNLSAAGAAIRLFGSGHTVGGTGSGEGNIITNNDFGIGVSAGTGHAIRGNAISDNAQLGIDYNRDGVTPNDDTPAGNEDDDDGVNRLQNFPVIQNTSYDEAANEITVTYEVPSQPGLSGAGASTYPLAVDFYRADGDDEEGEAYLHTDSYTASNFNNGPTKTITFTPDVSVSTSDQLVATATDTNDNTSEFSEASDPLPVELASFEGTQTGRAGVELRWTTSSEQNNAGFEIQRRRVTPSSGEAAGQGTGATPGWKKAGFVESKAESGTVSAALSYRFTAEDLPVGTHEFRLKQVDLDGSTTVHRAVTVELRMEEALRMSTPAPHPVQSGATLSFAVKEKQETTLRLYNTLGQQVATLYRGTPTAGETQTVQLSASDLTSGTYFLRLRTGERTRTQRVTVVR